MSLHCKSQESPYNSSSMSSTQGSLSNRSHNEPHRSRRPSSSSSDEVPMSTGLNNSRGSRGPSSSSSDEVPMSNCLASKMGIRSAQDRNVRRNSQGSHRPSSSSSDEIPMSSGHAAKLSMRSGDRNVRRNSQPSYRPSSSSSDEVPMTACLASTMNLGSAKRSLPNRSHNDEVKYIRKNSQGSGRLSTSSSDEVQMSAGLNNSRGSRRGSSSSSDEVQMSSGIAAKMNMSSAQGSLSNRSHNEDVNYIRRNSQGSGRPSSSSSDEVPLPSGHNNSRGSLRSTSCSSDEVPMSSGIAAKMSMNSAQGSHTEEVQNPRRNSKGSSRPSSSSSDEAPMSSGLAAKMSISSAQGSVSNRSHYEEVQNQRKNSHGSCQPHSPSNDEDIHMTSFQGSGDKVAICGSNSSMHSGISITSDQIRKDVHDHYAGIGSYLQRSYENQKIADVGFKVGERILPVHKVVLASQSQLFRNVFESHPFTTDPQTPKLINIRNVNPEALGAFINYLYNGQLEAKTHLVADLLKLAETLRVDGVKQILYSQALTMKYDEILELLESLKGSKHVRMCNILMEKICRKFRRFIENPAFYHLDIETVCFILSNDKLKIECENDIFDVAVRWLNNQDPAERAGFLDQIMACVRFPLMTQKQLFLCYKKCPMLRESPICREKITLANW